jgi:hypothetical protein
MRFTEQNKKRVNPRYFLNEQLDLTDPAQKRYYDEVTRNYGRPIPKDEEYTVYSAYTRGTPPARVARSIIAREKEDQQRAAMFSGNKKPATASKPAASTAKTEPKKPAPKAKSAANAPAQKAPEQKASTPSPQEQPYYGGKKEEEIVDPIKDTRTPEEKDHEKKVAEIKPHLSKLPNVRRTDLSDYEFVKKLHAQLVQRGIIKPASTQPVKESLRESINRENSYNKIKNLKNIKLFNTLIKG